MFRNPRRCITAVLVVAALLLAAVPAAAGVAGPARGPASAWAGWEGLVARVFAWLGWQAERGVAGRFAKYSSSIDPNGQPMPAGAPGTAASPDSGSQIDPDGHQ